MRVEKLWVLFLTLISMQLYAQENKKKSKDFLNIKAPSIKYSNLDTSEVLFEEEFRSNAKTNTFDFDPGKKRSLVEEDTNSFSDEDLSIVEVSEQLNFDSVWVTIAEYFAIWDSRTINPYKKDGSKFSDTLTIALYDSLSGFNWSMPLQVCASTSEFGMRHTRWHYGIDLDLETGDPVLATFDGIVRISHNDPGGYGNYVLLRHYNGLETLYGHLTRPEVQIGQLVKAGDMIGLGGNTGRSSGSHLHFEVRYEGHAINPEHLYDFNGNRLRDRTFTLTPEHFQYLKQSARKVISHTVRSGETLSSISRKYRISSRELAKLNRISHNTTLRVGKRLRIR